MTVDTFRQRLSTYIMRESLAVGLRCYVYYIAAIIPGDDESTACSTLHNKC